MFTPSRDDVRNFFSDAWKKHRQQQILTPLETMAVDVALMHPEYHGVLDDPDNRHHEYPVEKGQTNPFLHMSMHLAIEEQLSIDHPKGIKAAYEQLIQTHDRHAAIHIIMEALGEVIWEAQRLNQGFDSDHYLDLIRRHATR